MKRSGDPKIIDRRRFLVSATGTLAVVSLPLVNPCRAALAPKQPITLDAGAGLSARQWQLLVEVQDHLFPSEPDAPGAKDVNAITWLHNVLSDPHYDVDDRRFVAAGAEALDQLARDSEHRPFIALDEAQREAVLRRYEQRPGGRQWLGMILEYILEALLTDPVYGTNPNGIGWRWLEHSPGFRRPPAEKRYFLL